MASARPRPGAKVLEAGNVAFFYRPIAGVEHPQSSDQVEHVYLALFPDEQSGHQNRLITFAHGYFPPIIPGQSLPEERDWAYVADVEHDACGVVQALGSPSGVQPTASVQTARPAARIAGQGRYAIARSADHTYFAHALSRPRQLGIAQQTLLLDLSGSYVVVVKEPSMPSPLNLDQKPVYPPELDEAFDGHGAIPLDPTTFLDYRWTQIFLVGADLHPAASLGIAFDRDLANPALHAALACLRDQAQQLPGAEHVDIFKPLQQGMLE